MKRSSRSLRYTFSFSALSAALLATIGFPAFAEDIDIFENPSTATLAPNVLLMIDNGANWSSNYTIPGVATKSAAVSEAIYTVASDSEMLNDVRLGMMTFTKSKPDGGKVIAAVKTFDTLRQGLFKCLVYNKQVINSSETTCVAGNGLALEDGNNSSMALAFNEAYLYFKGSQYLSGKADGVATTVGVKTGSGNNLRLGADPAAFNVSSSNLYASPTVGGYCANNFIILIGTINGGLQPGADQGAKDLLTTLMGREPSVFPLSPKNNEDSWADEYAAFLSNTDILPDIGGQQPIKTYVIDVFDPAENTNDPSRAARALYKSIAAQGKGEYFQASNAAEIAAALKHILRQVQEVNASFASASMPISMNVESDGTNENEVYIGMFRPDSRPRWMGNLKKYSYQYDAQLKKPFLVDKNGNRAYNPVTGFLNKTTVSYWTATSTYWNAIPGYEVASDSPDGPVVEKGATAQLLRNPNFTRTVYTTCSTCTGGLKTLSEADVGGSTQFYNWAIGQDVLNETSRNNAAERRPSIHGDVLHSRPAVLNYGGTTGIRVFYGSNDGLFRALDGENGQELWALALPEQLTRLKKLYDNNIAERHPYFADGSPTTFTTVTTDTSGNRRVTAASLFIPMRRGGNYIYALDVGTPASPAIDWKIQGGAGNFAELAQTWSTPKPGRVAAYPSRRVLFFGAGYDAAAEDYVPSADARPARSGGRGIYMVDADTGERLWFGTHSDMQFSVPGDLTLVNFDRDVDNYVDRAYFADTGGNIWRANFGVDTSGTTPAFTGSITKVADLDTCAPNSNVDCRKFLYHPSVVVERDGTVTLLIGSGDREHPFSTTVSNRFYAIKDSGEVNSAATGTTESELQPLSDSTTAADLVAERLAKGWYFALRSGEKVTGNALSQDGNTYFNTNQHIPDVASTTSCVGSLGIARQYAFSYRDPLAVVKYLDDVGGEVMPGGGFPPPPVPMTLKFGDDYWTGVGGMNPTDMGVGQPGARQKTFWAKEIDAN